MKDHYTEADLLETYYMEPGASMPIMMHLASCLDCAACYERLDRKMREAGACHAQARKPKAWVILAIAAVVIIALVVRLLI